MLRTNIIGFIVAFLVSALAFSGTLAVFAQTATETPSPSPTETTTPYPSETMTPTPTGVVPSQAPSTGVGYYYR